jgi:hypothetical protein
MKVGIGFRAYPVGNREFQITQPNSELNTPVGQTLSDVGRTMARQWHPITSGTSLRFTLEGQLNSGAKECYFHLSRLFTVRKVNIGPKRPIMYKSGQRVPETHRGCE